MQDKLKRLRTLFLDEASHATRPLAKRAGYWDSELLQAYDETFAQRIAWKWDNVLGTGLGLKAEAKALLDWGCGTGIASRRILKHLKFDRVFLHDRSKLAVDFAKGKIENEFSDVKVTTAEPIDEDFVLAISHVINELDDVGTDELLALCAKSSAILWVEPGTFSISRKLMAAREKLRETFSIVAPCTHREKCGMEAKENSGHWCHHFGAPPDEVFHDGKWAKFSKDFGIDLRSLPLSYLVLDRREREENNMLRPVGSLRRYKGYANILGCTESGVSEMKLLERNAKPLIKLLDRRGIPSLVPREQ